MKVSGSGMIGARIFEMLVNDPRLDNIPLILETPGRCALVGGDTDAVLFGSLEPDMPFNNGQEGLRSPVGILDSDVCVCLLYGNRLDVWCTVGIIKEGDV